LVDIPPGMDEAFRVNISKMRVSIPREVRVRVLDCLASVIKAGQEKYRSAGDGTVTQVTFGLDQDQLEVFAAEFGFEAAQLEKFVLAVGDAMSPMERRMFLSGLRRYVRQSAEATSSEQNVA
jgi:hypothetical protein